MPELMHQPGSQQHIKGLAPLTPKQLRDAERDKVYIFNTSPREYRTTICGRLWVIPACPSDAEVSPALVIPGAYYFTDVKKVSGLDVEYQWHTVDGADLARDIIGNGGFRHESCDLTRYGVFSSSSPTPDIGTITGAREKWFDRCDEKIREADESYAINGGMVSMPNGKNVSEINKDHLEAAEILGISDQKPWAKKNAKLVPCDECGTGNLPTAAFCKNRECGNMLNAELAKTKFPARYAALMGIEARAEAVAATSTPEPERRGPGRPTNASKGIA